MFGLARIGVLKSHTGCVESTRPRGVLGLVTIFFFFSDRLGSACWSVI